MLKILGFESLEKRFRLVKVGEVAGEPILLRVSAPRLGAIEAATAAIPYPLAPSDGIIKRDKRGNVIKDDKGRGVVGRNEEDPAYLAAKGVVDKARSAMMILASLGDQIEYDPQPANMTACDYWLKVLDELEDAGLDLGAWRGLNVAYNEMLEADLGKEVGDAREGLTGKGND